MCPNKFTAIVLVPLSILRIISHSTTDKYIKANKSVEAIMNEALKVLVTGATGFIGRHVSQRGTVPGRV